jgi:uncharacterized protein
MLFIIYLLLIGAAEAITVYGNPIWGTVVHIAVFVGLLVHSTFERRKINQHFLISLSLVPLVRIISLSMPLASVPRAWWYPIIYAPLLGAAIVVTRLLGYNREDVGMTFRFNRIQLLVAIAGFGLGFVEYLVLRPEPLISELTWQSFWLPALIFFIAVGFVEEYIFRGVLQRTSSQVMGLWGIVYTSALFALMHMGFYSWLDVIFVFGIALFFGWSVKKTGSLVGVTLSHGFANIVLYLIAPFLLR